MSWKTDIFDNELKLIKNNKKREMLEYIIDNIIPESFFYIPASSSGKYHPVCSRGKGGLIIHTKRLIFLAVYLAKSWELSEEEIDSLIIAGIVHDMCKEEKKYSKNHPKQAFDILKNNEDKLMDYVSKKDIKLIENMVLYHMGHYTPKEYYKKQEEYTLLENIIYFADYLSSRELVILPVDDFQVKYE